MSSRIVCLGLVFLGGVSALGQGPRPEALAPVEALRRADKLYADGDLLRAEPLYRQLVRVRPARGAGAAAERAIYRRASDRLLTLYVRLGREDRAVQVG